MLTFGKFQWVMILVAAFMATIEAKPTDVEDVGATSFDEGKWVWSFMALVGGLAALGMVNLGLYVMKIMKALRFIIGEKWHARLEQAVEVEGAAGEVQGDAGIRGEIEVQAELGRADERRVKFAGITEANIATARRSRRSTLHKKLHLSKNCSQLHDAVAFIEVNIGTEGVCRTCLREQTGLD